MFTVVLVVVVVVVVMGDAVQRARLRRFKSDLDDRIALQVNRPTHRLTESDFWYNVILSRRRP